MQLLVFTSNSLGGRQKELNEAVNKTTSWNFESSTTSQQDSDVLYKIDVASKFKNIKFLTEILKSGDSLYISRVLKHTSIFDEIHSDIMHPEYLHNEIFPYMSEKIKNKMLTAISINVIEENRIQEFCEYCFKTNKEHLGYKFLVQTPVLYRIKMIKEVGLKYDPEYLKKIIGNSFVVAEYCFQNYRWSSPLLTSHLYTVSPYEYLNLFEKYVYYDQYASAGRKFGLRLSKDILKNHKSRILINPTLYLNYLNYNTVCKYINIDETKEILKNILPADAIKFWHGCANIKIIKDLLNKIPQEERFDFIKSIFCNKYVGEEFEMNENFYNVGLHETMTKDQRKNWALQNIALDNGFFGDTNNYNWYKFLPFEDSFKTIKPTIHKTTDKHKRIKLLLILLESASNETEIEILLKYFYDRHINEQFKCIFIEKVVESYNIFTFNKNLWDVLKKLFLVVEKSRKCKTAEVLYSFLYDIPLSKQLNAFVIDLHFEISHFKENIKECDHKGKVIEKIISENIKVLENMKYEKTTVRPVLYKVLSIFEKLDIEAKNYEIIMKLASLDKNSFPELFPIKEEVIEDPLRLLKKDIAYTNNKIEIIYKTFSRTEKQVCLNQFLRKVRIYFGNDGSKKLKDFYEDILTDKDSNNKSINDAIYGIFALGNWDIITCIIKKYVPDSNRIKETDRNSNIEYIQTAICKFVGYCRPSIALNMIMPYVRGDYVKFCLPMFEILSANLPSPLCIEFIQLLLQKPVSVNKHGLRLAFRKFDSLTLIKVVASSWQNTKSVSLKQILFVSLYKHINKEKDAIMKKELITTLTHLMVSLTKDECNEQVIRCFSGNEIPDEFKGEFYDCAYKIVEKLKINEGIETVIKNISHYIHLIDEDLLLYILKDLLAINTNDLRNNAKDQNNHKFWELLAKYLVKIPNENVMEQRVHGLKKITSKLIESWGYVHDDIYIIQKLASDFFEKISTGTIESFLSEKHSVLVIAPVKTLLEMLTSSLPLSNIYLHLWRLNLNIIIQETVNLYRKKSEYNMPVAGNIEVPITLLVMLDIGRKLGQLVKQLVEMDQFIIYYLNEKEQIVNEYISSVFHFDLIDITNYEDLLIFLCLGLIETDIVENYMLALTVMPIYYTDKPYESQYQEILKKIECYENVQLKCMVLNKFYPKFRANRRTSN